MIKDPIIEEIHQLRNEHAARFNFDIAAICADYREHEKKSKLNIVSRAPKRNSESHGLPIDDMIRGT